MDLSAVTRAAMLSFALAAAACTSDAGVQQAEPLPEGATPAPIELAPDLEVDPCTILSWDAIASMVGAPVSEETAVPSAILLPGLRQPPPAAAVCGYHLTQGPIREVRVRVALERARQSFEILGRVTTPSVERMTEGVGAPDGQVLEAWWQEFARTAWVKVDDDRLVTVEVVSDVHPRDREVARQVAQAAVAALESLGWAR